MKKLLIITVVYNRAKYIFDTIYSILNQSYGNFDYAIIDDGSIENNQFIYDSFNDNRLIIINKNNQGFTKTLKDYLVDKDEYEYISLQGAGDISYSNRVEEEIKILDKLSNIGIVSTNYKNRYVDSNRIINNIITNNLFTINDIFKKNSINHGGVMFRYNIYKKAGGYRELYYYAQDKDLWLRMLRYSNAYVISDILYERVIISNDNVSNDREKTLMQIVYSEFAKQCKIERDNEGHDSVDLYGNRAILFRKKYKKAFRYALKAYFKYLLEDNLPNSKRMLYIYLNERSFNNIQSIFLYHIFNNIIFQYAFKKILKCIKR